MTEFFFFLRIMFFTAVTVLLMQVRWGEETIENHTMNLLTTSAIVAPIDTTAQGAVVFIRNSWNSMTKSFNTRFSNSLRGDNQPGSRLSGLNVGRSQAVEKQYEQRSRTDEVRDYLTETGEHAADAGRKIYGEGKRVFNQGSGYEPARGSVDNNEDTFEKLKSRARAAGAKIRSRFIDETKNPVESGAAEHARGHAASSPQEDEEIVE